MRPNWDEYFMEIAELAAKRSTCLRRQVGAVLVRDKRILATGYNGAPRGLAHCETVGCMRENLGVPSGQRHEMCRAVHAEMNLVAQAAYHGVETKGSVVYCTHQPCVICLKLLLNAGIEAVYFRHAYDDPLSREIAKEAGIIFKQLEGVGATVEDISLAR